MTVSTVYGSPLDKPIKSINFTTYPTFNCNVLAGPSGWNIGSSCAISPDSGKAEKQQFPTSSRHWRPKVFKSRYTERWLNGYIFKIELKFWAEWVVITIVWENVFNFALKKYHTFNFEGSFKFFYIFMDKANEKLEFLYIVVSTLKSWIPYYLLQFPRKLCILFWIWKLYPIQTVTAIFQFLLNYFCENYSKKETFQRRISSEEMR